MLNKKKKKILVKWRTAPQEAVALLIELVQMYKIGPTLLMTKNFDLTVIFHKTYFKFAQTLKVH